MNALTTSVFASLLLSTTFAAEPLKTQPAATKPSLPVFREIRYDARISEQEAFFTADISVDSAARQEVAGTLFQGELALLPPKLPSGVRIDRNGNDYRLIIAKPGHYQFKVELVARITQAEPWNTVSFAGPPAAIASISAQAAGPDVELELLTGTVLESVRTNGTSSVKGFLGADQTLALRWQSKAAEVARNALLTTETTAAIQISEAVIKYSTEFHYDVLQGKASAVALTLPDTHSLTRLVGDGIRDWQIKMESGRQILHVEFLLPIEKCFALTVISEQPIAVSGRSVVLALPQPLDIQRQAGQITVTAEDISAEVTEASGLRQINAPAGALAAYRFYGPQFALAAKLSRIEPVVNVSDRITARLEEMRLVVAHAVSLNVEKAGIYTAQFSPQPGLVVTDVHGDGVDNWKMTDEKLQVNFSSRVLGDRKLDVELEQSFKTFPEKIGILPLRLSGAAKETAQLGAASEPGIQLKTADVTGAREIPVAKLVPRSDELLAYTTEQPDWKISLAAERLSPRVVAEIFNLVTVGDGIVGGSATIRYGLLNQGVQDFRVRVPANWKNVEFTGANIRRKELAGDLWTISLQDKAWDGYTLVVTYDYQFEPKGALLPIGGIHALGIERETGSIAITTAANLKLDPKNVSENLRRIDEMELAATDQALITRSVLLAYQYTDDYDLSIETKKFDESPVLSAVADRAQLTTTLNAAGQMLTQASFMVKNNDKQFQTFHLPKGVANVWSCYVNGYAVKPERDGDSLMVPLPREADRDQAFDVDIVYAQKGAALGTTLPHSLQLEAPATDVPTTYAEWELFAPSTERLSRFGGNMIVARGTTYGLSDAWEKFIDFYVTFLREDGAALLGWSALILLIAALIAAGMRKGMGGLLSVFAVFAIIAILSAMLLPALSKAKARALRIQSVNNLKQIGLAVRIWSGDNSDKFPNSLEDMTNELGTEKVTIDPDSGQKYIYVGAGMDGADPEAIIAYSPVDNGHGRNVLLADGSVQQVSSAQFAEMSSRNLQRQSSQYIAQREQNHAVQAMQFPNAPTVVTVEPPTAGAAPAAFGGATAAPAPVTSGIRPLRIEIPRTGQLFTFTKVLNLNREPLSVQIRLMSLRAFQTAQMIGQVTLFLAGLIVAVWQWYSNRNTLVITLALALMIVSVGDLLIAWRLLHTALIWGVPALLAALVVAALWKFWPKKLIAVSHPEPPTAPSAAATTAVLLLFASGLGISSAEAWTTDDAPAVSIISASYSGAVVDQVAQIDATIRVSAAKPGQQIPLFDGDVAVQQFSAKSGVQLIRESQGVAVHLPQRGETTLQLKLLLKLGGDVSKRHLTLAIPAALSSRMSLLIDQPDADVDFPSAVSFKRTTTGQQTRVDAVIGSSVRLELAWTPRVKRAAEITASAFVHNACVVSFGNGVLDARAALDYQIPQGELRQARVQLPAGQHLLRVDGSGIRTWEINPAAAGNTPDSARDQVLVVELLKDIPVNWRLIVETEQALPGLPAMVPIEVPHALDVKRETGLVALRSTEELSLSAEPPADLERVDADEFARAMGEKTDGIVSVFRFLKPEFSLQAKAEAVEPQIEAVVRNNVRLASDQATLSATVDYTIKRAGVFALKLLLPPDYRVDEVVGNSVLQWTESTNDTARLLEVTLKERTAGAYSLRLDLSQTFKDLPKSFAVFGVHPLNVTKLSGFVSVSAEPGVAVKTESFDALTEVPAVSLPDYRATSNSGSVLAYKFISPEPKSAPAWKLSVATEVVEAWVRAEVVNAFTVTESLVSGRAIVRYDIQNAPIKELRLKIPDAFRNVELAGPNIRRRDHSDGDWRIELQNKIRGSYLLIVTWDQPPASRTNALQLVGVSVAGVERETGILAIVAKPPLQLTEKSAAGLVRIDSRDLPGWAGSMEDAALAYRYPRPGYSLTLETKRFDDAQVLEALVENVNLTTVVADDGQMMTSMALTVRNSGRQHLEIDLPPGASNVWSAFVDGQAVRPSLREGKLLLPLESAEGSDAPIDIELTYVGASEFPASRGPVELISPKLDLPFKNAHWEVFLPPDYDYRDFSGTMTRESVATSQAASFSVLEYNAREQQNRSDVQTQAKSKLSAAKQQLSGGNVKAATANYYNVLRNGDNNGLEKNTEAKKLEEELRKVQSSNLINAQQNFTLQNNGNNAAAPAPEPGQTLSNLLTKPVQYDAAAAEAQWAKLQEAQEVTVAKVRPLRVNLPTRGLRQAFTQVLQTETDKAMTIRMLAVSTRHVSWLGRFGAAALGLLGLWVLVSIVSWRMARTPSSA